MEYAILSLDKDPIIKQLNKMGKNSTLEELTPSVLVLKTEANALDLKTAMTRINKCDPEETCHTKLFEKDTRYVKKIRQFLMSEDKLKLAILKA